MDRLLTRILLTTLLLCQSASCFASDAFYSIAGDVKAPQTYKFAEDTPVGSRHLLTGAEAEAEQGTLYVIRDGGRTLAAIDSYGTQQATPETILEHGDQVIVVAASPVAHQCGNAVVLLNSVPDVFKFEQRSLPVASFLSHLQLPLNVLLEVTRVENGIAVSRQLSSSDSIFHGDVVRLNESINRAGLTVPEAGLTYLSPPTEPGVSDPAPVLTVSSPEGSLLTIPTGNDITTSPVVGSIDGTANGQMELLPAEPVDLATIATQNESDSTTATPTAIRSVSLSSPVPGSTTETSPANAGSNAIWNTVFVGGLLVAMALIAVGWMKTQNEINGDSQQADDNQVSEENQISREVEAAPVNLPPLNDTNELGVTVDDDCPVLSAGLEEGATTEPELLELNANEQQDVQVTESAAIQTDNVVLTESWFEEQPAVEVASEDERYDLDDAETKEAEIEYQSEDHFVAAASEEAAPALETESETIDEAEAVPQTQLSDNDLEDLIQNRIPVELTTAQLPLRVNLFGEPAGPKRLRIDAAHTEIAPPHMMKKAPAGRSTKPVAATVKSPEGATSGSTGDALGHLDRALNYLEEQTDE